LAKQVRRKQAESPKTFQVSRGSIFIEPRSFSAGGE
jgi:hypothetical protein